MRLVILRVVFRERNGFVPAATTDMPGDASALVQDLDGCRRNADFHLLVAGVLGHALEVAIEGDVIVDVHPRPTSTG